MSTPVIVADKMVILTKGSLLAYKLSLTGPKKSLWRVEGHKAASGCSPTVYDGHVYTDVMKSPAICVNLETGKLVWKAEAPESGYPFGAPAIVDGKVFSITGDGKIIRMFKASPEKYKPLARAGLKLVGCTTPAIVDGKMYVRTNTAVQCYELRKK